MARSQEAYQKTAMDIAATMLGKVEGRDREDLKAYLSDGGVNLDPARTAWCAAFVNASLAQAGYPTTNSNMARSFLSYGVESSTPQVGDIVVLSRGSGKVFGHVGFYNKTIFDAEGKVTGYQILGGNQQNSVSYKVVPASKVLGIRRPDGSTVVDGRPVSPSVLKAGMTGSGVSALQTTLNELGFKGADGKALTVDGEFGPQTTAAVKTFQISYGLGADGRAGPQTSRALSSTRGALAYANNQPTAATQFAGNMVSPGALGPLNSPTALASFVAGHPPNPTVGVPAASQSPPHTIATAQVPASFDRERGIAFVDEFLGKAIELRKSGVPEEMVIETLFSDPKQAQIVAGLLGGIGKATLTGVGAGKYFGGDVTAQIGAAIDKLSPAQKAAAAQLIGGSPTTVSSRMPSPRPDPAALSARPSSLTPNPQLSAMGRVPKTVATNTNVADPVKLTNAIGMGFPVQATTRGDINARPPPNPQLSAMGMRPAAAPAARLPGGAPRPALPSTPSSMAMGIVPTRPSAVAASPPRSVMSTPSSTMAMGIQPRSAGSNVAKVIGGPVPLSTIGGITPRPVQTAQVLKPTPVRTIPISLSLPPTLSGMTGTAANAGKLADDTIGFPGKAKDDYLGPPVPTVAPPPLPSPTALLPQARPSTIPGSTGGRYAGPASNYNPSVAQLQTALNSAGFLDYRGEALKIDGVMGPRTQSAFNTYQSMASQGAGYSTPSRASTPRVSAPVVRSDSAASRSGSSGSISSASGAPRGSISGNPGGMPGTVTNW